MDNLIRMRTYVRNCTKDNRRKEIHRPTDNLKGRTLRGHSRRGGDMRHAATCRKQSPEIMETASLTTREELTQYLRPAEERPYAKEKGGKRTDAEVSQYLQPKCPKGSRDVIGKEEDDNGGSSGKCFKQTGVRIRRDQRGGRSARQKRKGEEKRKAGEEIAKCTGAE